MQKVESIPENNSRYTHYIKINEPDLYIKFKFIQFSFL